MEHNAFIEGIEPGGLTMDYEVKILICYILYHVKKKMTFTEINFILQSDGVVNYFEYAKAISELLNSKHILNDNKGKGEQIFALTPLGESTAQTFEKDIPITIREKSVKAAEEYLLKKKIEEENTVKVKRVDDGYNLSLQITDIGSNLLDLTLFVPTKNECDEIKSRFLSDPTMFYRGIIALLTADNDTVESILMDIHNNRDKL